jgi:hypothetical protein
MTEVHIKEPGDGTRPFVVHRSTIWVYITCMFIILGAIAASVVIAVQRDDQRAAQNARNGNVAAAQAVASACSALFSTAFNPSLDAQAAAVLRADCWNSNGLNVPDALSAASRGRLRQYLENPRRITKQPSTTTTTTKEHT